MCHGQMLSNRIGQARVEHYCSSCRRAIEPGDVYENRAQVFEDEFTVWKGCRRCMVGNRVTWDLDLYGDSCYYDERALMKENARELGWRAYLAAAREARRKLVARILG